MTKKVKKYKDYDDFIVSELADPEFAMAYLNEALKETDRKVFLIALSDVLEAQKKDVSYVARRAHLSRQNLYRMLSSKGNPRWDSLNALFNTLDLQIQLVPKDKR